MCVCLCECTCVHVCACVHVCMRVYTCMYVLCMCDSCVVMCFAMPTINLPIVSDRIELEAEIRVQVDELMKEELKNLKLVSCSLV